MNEKLLLNMLKVFLEDLEKASLLLQRNTPETEFEALDYVSNLDCGAQSFMRYRTNEKSP